MSEKSRSIPHEAILHDLYVVVMVIGVAWGAPTLALEWIAKKPDMIAGVAPVVVSAVLALLYTFVFPTQGNKEEI